MKWHKLTLNPRAVEKLYKIIPEIESVELLSINLNFDDSSIVIRFDLPQFPDYPSPRWKEEFNTVQIRLAFWRVAGFEAKGWREAVKVKIDIKKRKKL